MRSPVIVVVPGTGADCSRGHILPCRGVEDPLAHVVGIDAAAVGVYQEQGRSGNAYLWRARFERIGAPFAELRLRRRDQASARVTQRRAPRPAARYGADQFIFSGFRRRVGDRRHKNVRIVIRIEPFLDGAVVWVGVDIAADILRLGEGISGADIQSVRETPDEFHLERIVVAIALIDEFRRQRAAIVLGERPQALRHAGGARETRVGERNAGCHRRRRANLRCHQRSGSRVREIEAQCIKPGRRNGIQGDEAVRRLPDTPVADVCGFNRHVFRQLPL